MPVKTVRVVIEGRVQAVWFRAWTIQEAELRNLRGWVRNRPDGTVEALFSGAEADVDDMIEACWQGPPAARVVNITEHPAEAPEGDGFGHLPTF
ncbi:MAG: acylphosphatase [Rhodospirillaceae bacterium]|jgi:acylphosphatase|nr:acylphosphatase [Rhodospirillaceae bacterium]|tara:strand:+ start:859 stop:1140 length:282 start_codon:yes stop_codon:yes gene_type:complete